MSDSSNINGGIDATSLSLIERAKQDDQMALVTIRELYHPLVYLWCRTSGLSADASVDVAEDVFVTVLSSLSSFNCGRPDRSFRGWLRTITKSRIVDHHRARGTELSAKGGSTAMVTMAQQPFPAEPQTETFSELDENHIVYERAIQIISNEFPVWYGAAFLQIVIQGKSPAEVAAELGQNVGAVYNAKARVLKRLRQEFAGLFD